MILYKYMSEARALQMLESGVLPFSQARAFNDPTEMSAAGYDGEDTTMSAGLPRPLLLNQSYAICCLTRTPLNPIMWAHYGDRHRGIVLGIDTNEAGLNSLETCVLPAQYGGVIYTASKPIHQYPASDEIIVRGGGIRVFEPQYLEALQRMFLHKSTEWSYEEEVRIVRATRSFGEEGCEHVSGGPESSWSRTYLPKIPIHAIRSVHLGWHAGGATHDATAILFKRIKKAQPMVDLYKAQFKKNSWGMQEMKFTNWEEEVARWYYPED